MADLGLLRVSLIADIAKFSKGLSRAEQIAQKRSRAIRNTIRSIGGAFGAISVGSLVGGTVRAFSEFEKNLVAVGKTANLEGKALEEFGNKILDIGKKVPVSNNALLQIAATAAQVGVQGSDNIAKFTETMARLELATDVAGEEGAQSIARLLNVTKTAITDVDKFGNVLVELGNNSAATESQIVEMSTKIGSAIARFGVTANEVAAYGAAFKSIGQEADATSSVLSKTFIAIAKFSRQGGEDLQRVADIAGMTAEEFRKLFQQNAAQAVNAFIIGLGKINDAGGDVDGTLSSLGLTGDRVSKVLGSMANASGEITSAWDTMNRGIEENNALFIESMKSATTFSGQMVALGNAANSAAVELGRLIAPAALKAIEGLSKAARALADNMHLVADAAKVLAAILAGRVLGGLIGLTTQSALFAAATGKITAKMLGLSIGLRAATTAGFALKGALAFFGGPIGVGIAALTSAYIFLTRETEASTIAQEAYERALKASESTIDGVGSSLGDLTQQRIADTIATRQQAIEELKLQKSRLLSAAASQKNALGRDRAPGGNADEFRRRAEATQKAIADVTREIEKLIEEGSRGDKVVENIFDKLKKKAQEAAIAAGGASDGVKQFGNSADEAANKVYKINQAMDSHVQKYKDIQAAQQRIEAVADQQDPRRVIQRDIEQIRTDIVYSTDEESIALAKQEMGDLMDEYNRRSQGLSEQTEKTTDEMSEFAIAAARSMQQAMSSGFYDIMQGETDNLAANFKRTIDSMVADLLSSQLLDFFKTGFSSTASGGGGWGQAIMSFFQFAAKGGSFAANTPLIVGEEGPEVFVPRTAGTVLPSGTALGNNSTSITVITPDANSFRRSQRQIAMDQSRMQAQAQAFA